MYTSLIQWINKNFMWLSALRFWEKSVPIPDEFQEIHYSLYFPILRIFIAASITKLFEYVSPLRAYLPEECFSSFINHGAAVLISSQISSSNLKILHIFLCEQVSSLVFLAAVFVAYDLIKKLCIEADILINRLSENNLFDSVVSTDDRSILPHEHSATMRSNSGIHQNAKVDDQHLHRSGFQATDRNTRAKKTRSGTIFDTYRTKPNGVPKSRGFQRPDCTSHSSPNFPRIENSPENDSQTLNVCSFISIPTAICDVASPNERPGINKIITRKTRSGIVFGTYLLEEPRHEKKSARTTSCLRQS